MLSLCNAQKIMERPLFEIQELKTFWRKQNFVFTNEQQFKYDKLIAERQKQVKSFYKDNLVYKA